MAYTMLLFVPTPLEQSEHIALHNPVVSHFLQIKAFVHYWRDVFVDGPFITRY